MTLILASCSMTKNIPDGEKLFAGLKPISYPDEKDDDPFEDHLDTTKGEVEAALATAPNGSLFGSSYYTVPWSWHLWVYNKYSQKNSGFARWMTKSFGTPPVLMSKVNPALHASVARSVLRNNGYFRGDVTYDTIQQKNPKKQKIAYTVHLDSLFTLDSIAYVNFPDTLQTLIDSTRSEACIKTGDAFSVSALDAERIRISNLFRNNGYYYYNSGYASYLADTFGIANKAQLRFQLADGLPPEALQKKYIGNITVNFRKSMREQLSDSIQRRHLTIKFSGKKSPVRPRVILKHLRLFPRQPYSYANYQESSENINATNVFSSTDFLFTPRAGTDTLDVSLNCVFDKPYGFYVEGNAIAKTIGNYGPELRIGITRRNAFRGAENLDINLHGNYEWHRSNGSSNNTYQYGADVAFEFPRIIAPFYNSDRVRRNKSGRPVRRFYTTPTTYAKVSYDIVRRPQYYSMRVVSGEWTYRWQKSESSRHQLSPITLKYQFKNSTTFLFDSIVGSNIYLATTMDDYFIPKMRYTYTYTSPSTHRNPIRWETTVEEAGNLISLFDRLRGKSFTEKDKELFNTPYAQFLRLETDFTKTWLVGMSSKLVAHLNAGYIWSYGNSDAPPFTEMYYTGGANSIRAYGARELGPGATTDWGLGIRQLSYLIHNGDMRLVGNLEYRFPIFGNLHGAIFLDAGNVWNFSKFIKDDDLELPDDATDEDIGLNIILRQWADQMNFKPSRFLKDIAIGTGVGLRYDLGFLVIRIDWGYALHSPYDSERTGYFNAGTFNERSALHFAIGYPF